MPVSRPRYAPQVAAYFPRPVRPGGTMLTGQAGSERQGALVRVAVDVSEGRLYNVGFRVWACPHIIAACNRLAEALEGGPVKALVALDLDELLAEFDIPVEKAGKILILKDALQSCHEAYEMGGQRQASS